VSLDVPLGAGPVVPLDDRFRELVLVPLVQNALRFSRPAGQLEIESAPEQGTHLTLTLPSRAAEADHPEALDRAA
jgi:signal transduction histidine kinase